MFLFYVGEFFGCDKTVNISIFSQLIIIINLYEQIIIIFNYYLS